MENIRLYDYTPNFNEITLNDNVRKIKVRFFKIGPRGIVAMAIGSGPILLWDKNVVNDHINDTEEQLVTKLKEVLD